MSQCAKCNRELGPGKGLAGLVKRIAKDLRVVSVGAPDDLAKAVALLS